VDGILGYLKPKGTLRLRLLHDAYGDPRLLRPAEVSDQEALPSSAHRTLAHFGPGRSLAADGIKRLFAL
jgi:hypothetical protein